MTVEEGDEVSELYMSENATLELLFPWHTNFKY